MKIEIENPVVPQFVADWIEQLRGQDFNSVDLLEAVFLRNYDIAELKILKWFDDNKERAIAAILCGYEVEQEPLYYAKIKGWELASSRSVFWNYHSIIESPMLPRLYTGDKEDKVYIKTKMTIEDWNKRGINDTNADFEEAD